MRLRSFVVGSALCALTAASPAAAAHAPYFAWMGIIEITSTLTPTGGVNVTYTFSGFAPTNWSGGCSIPDPYGPLPDITTTVSCTPPPPPAPFDINRCGVVTVVVSSTAPPASPGTVSGTSSCSGISSTASAPAGTAATGVPSPRGQAGTLASFPWNCSATAPPTVHQWTVRCTVTH